MNISANIEKKSAEWSLYVVLFAWIVVDGILYEFLGKEMLFKPNMICVLLEQAFILSRSKSDGINSLVLSVHT